ncbi:DUF2326 domain-containing protein [Ruegeria faecimaris]|uniref:Uncharacterized protein YydD, contains DUF2326 domain n=1 Tax=Ruegeria faecimaris TaxID=686389 RepID=A0A521AEG6_9RHOB|nr:DUF2326 domain-containing protein [Ruegeria faecimaris]SMO33204.1 Uncharacterized protein YydD, contains DUF2326 domain [Ruegeria faecimaris]
MILVSLTCDRSSFKPLYFNREGISLIVGDASKDDASSNGVGKTLTLKLVHHCLGANKDRVLEKSVPDWVFSLEFELHGKVHTISRQGDGSEIKLNGSKTSLAKVRRWLNEIGPFDVEDGSDGISFRSLYGRFARLNRADRVDPVVLAREQDYQALTRTLYLLGTDVSLSAKKVELRSRQLEIQEVKKLLKSRDERLQQLLLGGVRPETHLKRLENEINGLRTSVETMNLADDYEKIKEEADRLTLELRQKESEIAVLEYQIRGIEASLQQRPDISSAALSSFYEGMSDVFKPEALKHFEDVEAFHHSLAKKRQERLTRDREALVSKKNVSDIQRSKLASQRDENLRYLSGKKALGDYEVVVRQLASKEQDSKRLSAFIQGESELQHETIEVRKEMAEQDARAEEYLKTRPIEWADEEFRSLVGELYPQEAAGIVLLNNTKENKLRYDLSVDVQGKDSDGINAARIMCFDWLVFMYGSHHTMGHVWHDNGLFDHIDPRQRAKWLSLTMDALLGTGKQYIVSLNTENYTSTLKLLGDSEKETAEQSVIVRLFGDAPEHKLLGIQIGDAR